MTTCAKKSPLTVVLFFLLQGIVGNLASGKSALVHRYLTGTYVQEESPEGMLFCRWLVTSLEFRV